MTENNTLNIEEKKARGVGKIVSMLTLGCASVN